MTTSLSLQAAALLNALRAKAEKGSGSKDGWEHVYLDNATGPFPRRSIPGLLSALAAHGVYKPVDEFAWGEVKMKDGEET